MSINLPLVTNRVTTWDALKGKPYILVSAKGISNGQSTIINDGADFGPDTMLGATSKDQYGPPYTQTAGIQEAMNYAYSRAFAYNGHYPIMPEIRLTSGEFNASEDIYLPLDDSTSTIPTFSLIGNLDSTYINLQYIYIGETGYSYINGGGFKIEGMLLNGNGLIIAGDFISTAKIYLRDLTAALQLNFSNVTNLATITMDNFLTSSPLYTGPAYQISATYLTCGTLFINDVTQIAVINMTNSIVIQSGNPSISFSIWEIDDSATPGYYGIQNATASGTTSTLNINIDSLVINTTENFFTSVSGSGTLNIKMHVKHLIFGSINNFAIPSGINLEEFTIDEITNLTTSSIYDANLPILSTVSGPTAGTVDMRFVEYATSHKKLIITFTGYENDSTTDQVINFPMPFSFGHYMVDIDVGLSFSNYELSSMTIIAPNSTSTFGGLVILEGY